ncbi:NAD(P)/FAD-dependent oxidoreductase [Candidatus Viadribacter manganicus]|uniref:NAD(FAD)-utilizing dehydrogenase n=1 Tax=Candidatus Viadribacter manganicus TaxID=1759059 RepID=A0A1B1AKL2_9PROT|nr:TIGR03862 family flavoprotein [Candidatus Viadribacter manganicus]ANP47109.1 NAD(FAD)-utilizing dehydrogenase [Candidatus Viadribacter manganicus]
MSDAPIAIIGAGPAGLIAADVLSAAGKRVVVYERMPSVARKFLMAGRGGLNLTHSESYERFLARYGAASERLAPILSAFTPQGLRAWADERGAETFVGSSGRVFPKALKASPLLRNWLGRLRSQGVGIRTRTTWRGWSEDGALLFDSGEQVRPEATLLAMGGASWPRLGSDGSWREILSARGVTVSPFAPANVGFNVAWSEHLRTKFAGEPLKTIALRHGAREVRGEVMITAYGIEGGAIYALTSELRGQTPLTISIDLRPDLTAADIAAKLARAKRSDTLSSTLRKALGLSPLAISLLYENGAPPRDTEALAARIKAVPVELNSARGLERAISSAGGVSWDAVDESLQLRAIPDTYAAGEMLDWEAPTGGYLLQACFATGVWAARAILQRL